ncbi:MAG: sigma-70 family RNA polymerase sigma factor [Deltaproteobacteria bacterium]|nr:sigma-70 family RNA polymerase sigma factor [Deltaproteobacteria bacterium]
MPSPEIAAFIAALSAEHRPRWPADAVGAVLSRARTDAEASWPALEVQPEALAAFLGARVDAEAGPEVAMQLELGSLALAWACASGSDAAIVLFRASHDVDVDVAVRRLGLDSAEADDVRQAVLSKLFVAGSDKIRSYTGRGPLGAWVRAVTVRQAISMGRRRAPLDLAVGEVPTGVPALADPERDYLQARYGRALREALHEAVGELPPEERNLLRFRFVDELTLDELARVFDVHRATVARRLAKARQQVRRAALGRLRGQLEVDGHEMDSLVRMVRSQLDLSLSGLLARPS